MHNISFYNILSAEFYKLKNNTAKILLLCFPVLISLIVGIILYRHSHLTYSPWVLFGSYCFMLYSFFYPMLLSFAVFSFLNIEYQNNGYKQLLTLPASKLNLYLAKYSVILFYTVVSITVAFVSYFLICNILGIIRPDLAFQDYAVGRGTYAFFFRFLIASICLFSIQLLLSMFFSNFMIPVSIASIGTIFVIIIDEWKYIDFYPYSYIYQGFIGFRDGSTVLFSREIIMAMIYTLVFSVSGYFVFERKSRKI